MSTYKSFIAVSIFSLTFLCSVSTAFADCVKDGVTYPPGTEIGGFICGDDGAWKLK